MLIGIFPGESFPIKIDETNLTRKSCRTFQLTCPTCRIVQNHILWLLVPTSTALENILLNEAKLTSLTKRFIIRIDWKFRLINHPHGQFPVYSQNHNKAHSLIVNTRFPKSSNSADVRITRIPLKSRN